MTYRIKGVVKLVAISQGIKKQRGNIMLLTNYGLINQKMCCFLQENGTKQLKVYQMIDY